MDSEKRRRWLDAFTVRTLAVNIALIATIFLTRGRWEAWVVEQELAAVPDAGGLWSTFSSHTERLLIHSRDDQMTLVDVRSGDILAQFAGREHSWLAKPFSQDGRRFAVVGKAVRLNGGGTAVGQEGTEEQAVHVVDTLTGRVVSSLPLGTMLFTLSADVTQVIAATEGVGIQIWDTETGERLLQLRGAGDWMEDATFSLDGRHVAVMTMTEASGTLDVWNARTGERVTVLCEGRGLVWGLRFSPNGKYVFARCDKQQGCCVWDWRTGQRVALIRCPEGSRHEVSRDGSVCVANFPLRKGTEAWCLNTARRLCRIEGPVGEFPSTSASGRRLVTRIGPDVVVYDLETGQRELVISWPYEADDHWSLPDITPDGRRILVAGALGKPIHVWDAASGDLLAILGDVWRIDAMTDDWLLCDGPALYHRLRPEQWWGVFCLWHFWLIAVLSLALAVSIWCDVKSLRQR